MYSTLPSLVALCFFALHGCAGSDRVAGDGPVRQVSQRSIASVSEPLFKIANHPSFGVAASADWFEGVSDPLNVLSSETRAVDGQYAQTLTNRWGDYSSMTVDPTDDCTFYYTTEYLGSDGGWHTKIGHFKLPNCL